MRDLAARRMGALAFRRMIRLTFRRVDREKQAKEAMPWRFAV